MRKNEKITALYERLSRDDFGKDDDQQRESNSISKDVYKRQLPKGSSRNREAEAKSWKQRPAGELGLCSMVNVSKSLLNVVSGNQAKVADKPEPKRCAVGCSPVSWEHMDKQDCRRIGGT